MQEFNVVIVGSGTAGRAAAVRCLNGGLKVAMIEHEPPGGTCSRKGCAPKKLLRGGTHALETIQRFKKLGVFSDLPELNWAALQAHKDNYVDHVPDNITNYLTNKLGVSLFHGAARFTGPNTMAAGDTELRAKYFVIASGSVPRPLSFPGAEFVKSSDDFLSLPELPESMLFIGGGYISMEFACIAAAAGAGKLDVTVTDSGPHPLKGFDPDLVEILTKHLTGELGINFAIGGRVSEVKQLADGKFAVNRSNGAPPISADAIFHGAGRVAAVAEMDLPTGGVESAPASGAIIVNEYMQSVSNSAVYAAGDCAATDGMALTPVADCEGQTAGRNIADGNKYKLTYEGTPSVVFTMPPLASVGMGEGEAKEKYGEDKLRIIYKELPRDMQARTHANPCLAGKSIRLLETDELLGFHLLGEGMEDTINVAALGIRADLTCRQIKDPMYAYPTASYLMRQLL